MATLQEIRQQYPQYADMPDTELAERLHQRFYADMPREDFYAKIGMKAPERSSPLKFFNKGIAEGLGGVVDLFNLPFQLAGIGSDEPFLGSRGLQRRMNEMGMAPPLEEQPPDVGSQLIRGTGQAVGGLLPMGGLAKVGQAVGGPVVKRISEEMLRQTATKPLRTGAAELGLGAASGTGAGLATKAFPDDPAAEALGALGGGLGPGAITLATAKLLRIMPLLRIARSQIAPFTKSGAAPRAERRVQGLVSDPTAAAMTMDQPRTAELTPAQRTGQTNLMALEKAVVEEQPKLKGRLAERTAVATQQLREAIEQMGDGGDPAFMRLSLQQRMDYLLGLLDVRAQQAAARAAERTMALSPAQKVTEAGTAAREELESAMRAARATEKELWGKVPMEVTVQPGNARTAFAKLQAETPVAQRDDISAVAAKLLDDASPQAFGKPKGTVETALEVWGLRSKLLEEAREARAAGNFNRARIADNIAGALLADLEAVPDVGEPMVLAREWTKALAQKFEQGPVGKVLGYAGEGGPAVAPELTLASSIGAGGPRGAVAAQRLQQAAPGTQEPIRQHLLNLTQRLMSGGKISPQAAERFLRENAELLEQAPGLADDVRAAARGEIDATRIGKRAEQTRRSLTNERQSYTAKYLGAPVGQEIDRIISSDNPRAFAAAMMRSANKDPSGRAAAGLRAGVVENLLRRAASGYDPETSIPLLSGAKLRETLADRKTRAVAATTLGLDKMKRLDKIANELVILEQSRAAQPPKGGVISDEPGSLLSLLVRTVAARHGAMAGAGTSGASLVTAGYFSKRAQSILGNLTRNRAHDLIVEAITSDDPELLRALLVDTTTPRGKAAAAQRLNAWLVAQPAAWQEDDDGGQ